MNHQERLELLGALSRAGVNFYKSHDLEVHFERPGPSSFINNVPPVTHAVSTFQSSPLADYKPTTENVDATKKLTDLIETLKMDDASLLDTIFPAGAGG